MVVSLLALTACTKTPEEMLVERWQLVYTIERVANVATGDVTLDTLPDYDHQRLTSLGMEARQCGKYINYKTSIMDPIEYMLESVYSDVDSLQIDTIIDCGISSAAFVAYVAKNA